MTKKSIAAILCSGILIGLCLGSPLVMSEVQNKNVVGKMQFDKREKVNQKKTSLTLLERVDLYRKSQQIESEVETESRISVFESPEEIKQEDVIKAVEKEWMRLYQSGLLAEPPNTEWLKDVKYSVQTYVNSQYEFVTIWEVYMSSGDGGERFDVQIEEESGKIIQLYHSQIGDYKIELYKNKYPKEFEQKDEKLLDWLSVQWGKYLEVESGESRVISEEARFSCDDGTSEVNYQISLYSNEMVISIQ